MNINSTESETVAFRRQRTKLKRDVKDAVSDQYFQNVYKRRQYDYSDDKSQDSEDDKIDATKGITMQNDDGSVTELDSNPQFKNYQSIFQNLLKVKTINTGNSIIACSITFDSARVITLTRSSDQEYYVKMYDLVTFEQKFEEKIGGDENQYIKCKDIEQNSEGTKYALAYYDDGKFRIRTFERQ